MMSGLSPPLEVKTPSPFSCRAVSNPVVGDPGRSDGILSWAFNKFGKQMSSSEHWKQSGDERFCEEKAYSQKRDPRNVYWKNERQNTIRAQLIWIMLSSKLDYECECATLKCGCQSLPPLIAAL